MKKMLIGGLAAAAIAIAGAAVVLAMGWIDVAADTPHSPVVHDLIEFARERAIARCSREIAAPADLDSAERARRGAGNYDAMCAGCHLAPGVADTEIRRGLYPQPPKLTHEAASVLPPEQTAARRFWIIKHGIKASGMPAWGQGGMADADIWDLVAFLRVLPTLSPQQYRQQVAASEGHSHRGRESPAPAPHPHDRPGAHAH